MVKKEVWTGELLGECGRMYVHDGDVEDEEGYYRLPWAKAEKTRLTQSGLANMFIHFGGKKVKITIQEVE